MKISEVLRKAKPSIKQHEYVCHAVLNLKIAKKDKIKTTTYIQKLLLPYHCNVMYWLLFEDIPLEQLTTENMLSYRHRWVDHMIKQLEKEGK